MMRFLLAVALVVVISVKGANGAAAFLPAHCSAKLPPLRTFPFLRVSESIHPTTLLRVATAANDVSETSTENKENEYSSSLPWSDFQAWALRDNLPKYVVSIPVGDKQELYALWRTLMREVIELGGYSIEMLQEMHARQLKAQETKNAESSGALTETPSVLPLLDEFEFEASGGLSGQVYGIPGVADGTRIVTEEVKDVQLTVPRGYVQTKDGDVAYELGTPLREAYSLDVSKVRETSSQAVNAVTGLAKSMSNVPASTPDEDPDTMLVRVGFLTAVLLSGATAINMLSHHLTVNVFWV